MNGTTNNSNINIERTTYGLSAGAIGQDTYACAFGSQAGNMNQAGSTNAFGTGAGYVNQNYGAVAMGFHAGYDNQGMDSIAIGDNTAQINQGTDSVAVGSGAGRYYQGNGAIALGTDAGSQYQSAQSICIGKNAGKGIDDTLHMGLGAIAIGYYAATTAAVPNYSIAIGDNCAPPGATGRLAFGSHMESLAASATIGANGAPPAQVAGYLILEHNGVAYKCPLYNM